MSSEASKITVMEVAQAMNVRLDKRTAWSLGAEIAEKYFQLTGEQPPKGNRPKTNGNGTHCFALYPRTWDGLIREAINKRLTPIKKETA